MKRKRSDRPVEKTISVPTSVVTKVDDLIKDPLTNRPPHGAWAKLVTALLNKWLEGEVVVPMPAAPKRKLDDLLPEGTSNETDTTPEV